MKAPATPERLHLLENSAADADVGGEGALLVDVSSLNGGLGGLEACNKVSLAERRALLAEGRTYRGRSFCRI